VRGDFIELDPELRRMGDGAAHEVAGVDPAKETAGPVGVPLERNEAAESERDSWIRGSSGDRARGGNLGVGLRIRRRAPEAGPVRLVPELHRGHRMRREIGSLIPEAPGSAVAIDERTGERAEIGGVSGINTGPAVATGGRGARRLGPRRCAVNVRVPADASARQGRHERVQPPPVVGVHPVRRRGELDMTPVARRAQEIDPGSLELGEVALQLIEPRRLGHRQQVARADPEEPLGNAALECACRSGEEERRGERGPQQCLP
jgi:hypothetical protein